MNKMLIQHSYISFTPILESHLSFTDRLPPLSNFPYLESLEHQPLSFPSEITRKQEEVQFIIFQYLYFGKPMELKEPVDAKQIKSQ